MTNDQKEAQMREAFERIADEWLGYKSINDESQYHMPGRVLREFGKRMFEAALASMPRFSEEELAHLLHNVPRTNRTYETTQEFWDDGDNMMFRFARAILARAPHLRKE